MTAVKVVLYPRDVLTFYQVTLCTLCRSSSSYTVIIIESENRGCVLSLAVSSIIPMFISSSHSVVPGICILGLCERYGKHLMNGASINGYANTQQTPRSLFLHVWVTIKEGLKPMYSFGNSENKKFSNGFWLQRFMNYRSFVNRFLWNHQYFEKIAKK